MKLILLFIMLISISLPAIGGENDPDCSSPSRWPTKSAFVQLKNLGATNNEEIDFTKTITRRISSEKIGEDLYRQVHLVTFKERSGKSIQVITVNDASHEECSMSGVKVYVISKTLGNLY